VLGVQFRRDFKQLADTSELGVNFEGILKSWQVNRSWGLVLTGFSRVVG
jgi:hypothetical protein